MKRLLLAALLTLPLISSCVRTRTVEVQVPVPVRPAPCLISPPPNSRDVILLGLTEEEGCPKGVVCIDPQTAIMLGLFMRDADKTFGGLYGCPHIKLDDTIYTALKRYQETGVALPTE